MAEIVNLFEVNIDTDQAVRDMAASQKAVDELKKEIKKLQQAEGDNSIAIAEATAQLKAEQQELRNNTKLTQSAIQAKKSQEGSVQQLRAQLAAVSIEWQRLSEDERANTEEGQRLTAQKKALTDALKEEEKATGDTRRNVGNYAGDILKVIEQLKKQQSHQVKTIQALKATENQLEEGSEEQRQYAIEISKTEIALIETKKELQKYGQEVDNITEDIEDAVIITNDASKANENYGDSIKDAIKGTTGFDTSLKALAVNPVVLTITAIVGLFKLFQAAVKRSEKATEAFNKITAVFKGVLDGIINALVPIVEFLSEKLVAAFENPVQSIKDLGNIILENIINRFKSVLVFGDALEQLFKGNFKEAAKLGADAFIQLGTGIENGTDKIAAAGDAIVDFRKSVVENVDKAIDANKNLANAERELLRIQKQFELQQLTFQKNAELQRQIRDDESKSIEERIEANVQLGKILDEQLTKELNLARKQLEFANLRKVADGDTLETQEAIFDSQIKIAEIEERIAGQRSEQLTNTNSLLKEQEELEIAELERLSEIADKELQIEIDKAIRSAEIEKERIEKLNEARALDFENRQILAEGNLFAELELEREFLEMQRQQEIEFAEKIGADTTLISEKYSKVQRELDKTEFQAKMMLAQDFANNIAAIAGENTAVGKAAAVAAATINTYQAATGAYASLAPIPIVGPVLGIAAAGAAVASGVANVRKILSIKSGLPGEKNVSAPGLSTSTQSNPVASVRSNVADDVTSGIISRDTTNVRDNQNTDLQPTLVVDSVTNEQSRSNNNNNTATI